MKYGLKTLKLLVPLIFGILIFWFFRKDQMNRVFIASIFCLLICVSLFEVRFQTWQTNIKSLLFVMSLSTIGYFLCYNSDTKSKWTQLKIKDISPKGFLLQITNDGTRTQTQNKYEAKILIVKDSNTWQEGQLSCYFFSKEDSFKLKAGDIILTNALFLPIRNAGNPHEFDFAEYSNIKGYYGRLFSKGNDYTKLDSNTISLFQKLKQQTQIFIKQKIRRYFSKENQALVIALTIGDRAEMDKTEMMEYSKTGVVHVISLSGLHVGILFSLFAFVFNLIFRHSKYNFIIILFLWFYAYIVGFGPSIVRSVLFLTVVEFGNFIGRRGFSLNTLFFVAFVLLLYNPFWLYDVGFQLSFTATFGILIFYQPLYSKVESKYSWLNKLLIAPIAVTLSAQIFTIPLMLFYFHLFPVTFIISNLLIAILGFVIVVLNTMFLIFSFIPIVAQGIAWVDDWFMNMMKFSMHYFSKFQPTYFSRINIDYNETIILLAVAFFCTLFFYDKKKNWGRIAVLLFSFFCIYHLYIFYHTSNQSKIVVYQINKNTVIDIFNKTSLISLQSENTSKDMVDNSIVPNRINQFANESNFLIDTFTKGENHSFTFRGKSIGILNNAKAPFHIQKYDILVLGNNLKMSLRTLKTIIPATNYIVDGSNNLWKIEQWKNENDVLSLPLHITSQQGAFEFIF